MSIKNYQISYLDKKKKKKRKKKSYFVKISRALHELLTSINWLGLLVNCFFFFN